MKQYRKNKQKIAGLRYLLLKCPIFIQGMVFIIYAYFYRVKCYARALLHGNRFIDEYMQGDKEIDSATYESILNEGNPVEFYDFKSSEWREKLSN